LTKLTHLQAIRQIGTLAQIKTHVLMEKQEEGRPVVPAPGESDRGLQRYRASCEVVFALVRELARGLEPLTCCLQGTYTRTSGCTQCSLSPSRSPNPNHDRAHGACHVVQ
jgi:hypothetical protein